MISAAFRDCCCTGKSNRKALACHTVEEGFTAGGTVKNRVACDDVFVASAAEVGRAANDDAAAG